MTDSEREYLQEAKTFAWAAPVILPLIQRRRKITFDILMSGFRQGNMTPQDQTARLAELSVLADLEREIMQKEQEYRTLEEQHANRK
jgi:hypothetical protein